MLPRRLQPQQQLQCCCLRALRARARAIFTRSAQHYKYLNLPSFTTTERRRLRRRLCRSRRRRRCCNRSNTRHSGRTLPIGAMRSLFFCVHRRHRRRLRCALAHRTHACIIVVCIRERIRNVLVNRVVIVVPRSVRGLRTRTRSRSRQVDEL